MSETVQPLPWADFPAYRAAFRHRCPVAPLASVLPALAERVQWLVWRYEPGETPEKKPRKMPYYADGSRRSGGQGSDADRARLTTYAAAALKACSGDFDGVGFAFLPGDGLVGIDLDGMIDAAGVQSDRCKAIIAACNSYTEFSPSGTGVHIIAQLEHIEGRKSTKSNAIGVECFIGAQFFTFTAACTPHTPFELRPLSDATWGRLKTTIEAARGRPHVSPATPATTTPPSPGDSPALPLGSTAGASIPAPAQLYGGSSTPGRSLAQEVATVEEALSHVAPDDYQTWIDVGLALRAGLGDRAGYLVWDAWSQRSPKYAGGDDTARRWAGFKPSKVTLGTVYALAEQGAWVSPWAKAKARKARAPAHQPQRPALQPPPIPAPAGALKGEEPFLQGDVPDFGPDFDCESGPDPLKAAAGGGVGAPPGGDDLPLGEPIPDGWEDQLLTRKGDISTCLANAELFLSCSVEWRGVIAYDEFAERTVFRRAAPFDLSGQQSGEWTDFHDSRAAIQLQRSRGVEFSPATVGQAVEVVARRHRFHPVRDALNALPPWDGIRRNAHWLQENLGVRDSDYVRKVGELFLRGMVKRVMEPGCKFDYCLVLEGTQGRGKSTAARILGWHWFGDTDLNLDSKDALLSLPGHWVYEIAEMGSLMKAEEKKQKSFLSRQEDEYRPPYGKRTIKVPRQSVFIGTTNEMEMGYLKDPTGARRFWPVLCGDDFELDGLRLKYPLMLAEALHDHRAGEISWPTHEEQARLFDPEQLARGMEEPYEDLLRNWVKSRMGAFTMAEAASDGLSLTPDKLTPALTTRVGIALRNLGCHRKEQRNAPKGERRLYVPPGLAAGYEEPADGQYGSPDHVPF
jgi:putative DNA primase/helicase